MLETFNCPSCNASLDLPDSPDPTVRCSYCGRTVMVPDELRQRRDSSSGDRKAMEDAQAEIRALLQQGRKIDAIKLFRQSYGVGLREAKEAVEAIEAQLTVWPGTKEQPQARKGGCAGLVLFLLIAIGVGVALIVVLAGQGGSISEALSNLGEQVSPANRTINGQPHFVPGVDGAAPDIIFQIQNFDDDTSVIAYYDGVAEEERWQGETQPRESAFPTYAVDQDLVFVVVERALQAYDRKTGLLEWEATLSDQIHSICVDCLQSFAHQVVGFTADGYLQAFDAESGEQLWRSKIEPVSSRRLFNLSPYLGVMNERDETGMGFEILDPESGDVVRRMEPRCQHPTFDDQEPDADDPVVVDGAAGTIILLFGFFEPGCVQQWSLESGRMLWNRFTELTSFSDAEPLNGRNSIVVSAFSGELYAVDKSGGEARLLASDEEYELSPLAESAQVLLAQATRRRGTRRDELWAIDTETGEIMWRHVPQAPEMLASGDEVVVWDSSEGYWHAHLTSRGIILMQARHQPARLLFETIDPLNGASSDQIELEVNGQFSSNYQIGLVGWQGSTVWLKADLRQIWAVDTMSAEIVGRWP